MERQGKGQRQRTAAKPWIAAWGVGTGFEAATSSHCRPCPCLCPRCWCPRCLKLQSALTRFPLCARSPQALHALVATHLCNKLGGGESSDHVATCVHVSEARVRASWERSG